MKQEFTIDELSSVARALILHATDRSDTSAVVLALSGDLGTGKTTLSQEVARILGVSEKIISPTFVIMKKYKTDDKVFKHLVHIDAYRLNHSGELLKLEWESILANPENLVIVEWPEHVKECFDKKTCHIKLSHINNETRRIEFT